MQLKKIEWYDGVVPKLRQSMASGLEYSFLSANNKQIFPFVYCKDYLQDAISAFFANKKRSIFGFVYDPAVHEPIVVDKTSLLIANSNDKDLESKIENCLNFLYQVEDHLKMTRTIVEKVENPPYQYLLGGVYFFEGSKRWMNSPPMISLYSLLIRIGLGHKINTFFKDTIDNIINGKISPYHVPDKLRLKDSKKGINLILDKGDEYIFHEKIEDNYPAKIKVRTMHNTLGIIGFSVGKSNKYMSSWKRD